MGQIEIISSLARERGNDVDVVESTSGVVGGVLEVVGGGDVEVDGGEVEVEGGDEEEVDVRLSWRSTVITSVLIGTVVPSVVWVEVNMEIFKS